MSVEISEKVRCTNCGKYQFEHERPEVAGKCDEILVGTAAITFELARLSRLQGGLMHQARVMATQWRNRSFPVKHLGSWGALHKRRHRA